MKEVLRTIVKHIVDNPEEILINQKEEGQSIILELKVADDDMGKVIGKSGRVAKAIRTVIGAAATKIDKQVLVKIID
ncbi:hypothetical protein U472_06090 [Orenia metallireducens]|uniref:RNA-binding protein KhpA n=1 Tax=Orenia metallireducens TaxID=1413210 RepID=A0A1C0A9T7_9FIRM|nr:KH domain-containing protein [Orenia metallireducens]OCL27052.1 hypothetical protein U472_06090 [Orenia metallireducens]